MPKTKRKSTKTQCPSDVELYLRGVMTMDDLVKINPKITMKELAWKAYELGYHVIPSLTIKEESAEAGGGLSFTSPSYSSQEIEAIKTMGATIDHHQSLADKLSVPRRVIKTGVIQAALFHRYEEIVNAGIAMTKTAHKQDADCRAGDHDNCVDAKKAETVFYQLLAKFIHDTESESDPNE